MGAIIRQTVLEGISEVCSQERRKERPIKNIESKFAGFITTRSQKFLFHFFRRTVTETGLLLKLRWNAPQLKN